MVSQYTPRNVYEESPDQLQELMQHGTNERGKQLQVHPSRKLLIEEHEKQLKTLSEGPLPIRNFILPVAYPPSRNFIQAEASHKTYISQLRIEERHANDLLVVRTIAAPYIYSATVTVIEDEQGNTSRLTLSNLEDSPVDPLVIKDTVLAIKQPCWTKLVNGGYQIRVDHPSDVVFLEPTNSLIPGDWQTKTGKEGSGDNKDWKKEGDMMFLKKRFRKALECYKRGLEHLSAHDTSAVAADLYRKSCGVNIVLLRLDAAAQDLSLAISAYAASTPSLSKSKLTDPSTVSRWLHDNNTVDPYQIADHIPRHLQELAARIKFDIGIYQNEPAYNLPLISSNVGPLTLHVDAANYLVGTEVRKTKSHGRGLFAKRAFKTGELVCAEKAFVLPGYFIQDRSSDCLLYNLGDGTACPRPGALLFKELVQKLRWNPSLRKEFFDLDDGGYWQKHGWKLEGDEEVPVDVFRVERIRQLNCFSLPTRSLDLISAAPNSDAELRNGFWIHASYVNHSCLPNTVRTFIGDVHFLRATRNIAAGEELTHQYVSPEIDIRERQAKLRNTWGFECDCRLCKADGAVPEENRTQRLAKFEELKNTVMKLGERGTTITSIKKISRGVRDLESMYSPPEGKDPYAGLPRLALVHPTLFLTEAWRGVKNTDKMMQYARQLLRNFGIFTSIEGGNLVIDTEVGLINIETVRALKYLAEGHEAKEEAQLSTRCLEIARSWFTIITGSETGVDDFLRL